MPTATLFRFLSPLLACCLLAAFGGSVTVAAEPDAPLPSSAAKATATPNVIVIMADDLGYGDVSCNGASEIQTPHIDRLAAAGRRFTSGYCSASTCTPTRYSFLTGTYAFRAPNTSIAPPQSPLVVDPASDTIAAMLRRGGYRTAVVGKWHLGLGGPDGPDWNGQLKPGPLELGFDRCFLLPTTNDRVPQVFVQDHRVLGLNPDDPLWVGDQIPSPDHPTGQSARETLRMDWSRGHNATIHNGISRIGFYTGGNQARFRDEDLADHWVAEAQKFIREKSAQPFFLFLASHDIHVPRMPHERFQGQSSLGYRGDAILEFDWTVGQVMQTLADTGLDESTLVIVCSDNGPVLDDGYADQAIEKNGDHRAGGPFKGGKYSVYEGGLRTPFIVHWPERIEPSVSDQVVCTVDLAASLAGLIGQPLPDDAFLDSHDVGDALWGSDADGGGRDHLLLQDNGVSGTLALRQGRWKLHRYPRGFSNNLVVERPLGRVVMPPVQLFDLDADPGETTNLADQHPDIVQRMQQRVDQLVQQGRSRPVSSSK